MPRKLKELLSDAKPQPSDAAAETGWSHIDHLFPSSCRLFCVPLTLWSLAGFWASVTVTALDACSLLLSLASGGAYLHTGGLWSLSNLFGVAFSMQGISLISIGSVKNGVIMLVRSCLG